MSRLSPLARRETARARIAWGVGATLLYALVFFPAYDVIWQAAIALTVVPIIVIASNYGLRGGLVAGLVSLPLNVLLLVTAGGSALAAFAAVNFWAAQTVFLIVGLSIGYMRDIKAQLETELREHRHAENALEESERRYRRLVEQSSDMVYTVDPDGNFTYVSPPAQTLTGYPASELVGRPVVKLVHPAWRARVGELYREQPDARQVDELMEFEIVTGFGAVRWVEQVTRAQTDGDRLIGFQSTLRDITERKLAEIEGEKLIGELDAFAHTVAHDLKNPLHVVLGYARIMLMKGGSFTVDEQREYLQAIESAGVKMEQIIDALMLLAGVRQMEAVTRDRLDMKHIVAEVRTRLKVVLEENQVELVVPGHWPDACGYAPWIEEVWVNYVSNAIKYGGQPPRVEMGAEALPGGTQVRFWVRDNGPGLTAEEQVKLFAPFMRLSNVQFKEGHGLGLSIVRRIVYRLDGEVGVESADGAGSTFWFSLPAA